MGGGPQTLRVKICGMTREEDVREAVRSGADAVGLVFAPSPRRVTPERGAELGRSLREEAPEGVDLFGLFVDAPPEEVVRAARGAGVDVVQLHGAESPDYAAGIARDLPGTRVVKAVRVRGPESIDEARRYDAGPGGVWALLLDAYVRGVAGGTGETFEWGLAAPLAAERRVILAGGLNVENVAEAVRTVRPYMVDVSSGVESAPGVKDAALVRDFIERAREAGAQ